MEDQKEEVLPNPGRQTDIMVNGQDHNEGHSSETELPDDFKPPPNTSDQDEPQHPLFNSNLADSNEDTQASRIPEEDDGWGVEWDSPDPNNNHVAEAHPEKEDPAQLKCLVTQLCMARTFLPGIVGPAIISWLKLFGQGNPILDCFKSMTREQLANYAEEHKIHAATSSLKSNQDDRIAILAIQKYHAEDIIQAVLCVDENATPEEEEEFAPQDYDECEIIINSWLDWQREDAEKLPINRLDQDNFDGSRRRCSLVLDKPPPTPTTGRLLWRPSGSATDPINNLYYMTNAAGPSLPTLTRVFDQAEDHFKLAKSLPSYPMLFTADRDGEDHLYKDQSRHRRGAIAMPRSTSPVPISSLEECDPTKPAPPAPVSELTLPQSPPYPSVQMIDKPLDPLSSVPSALSNVLVGLKREADNEAGPSRKRKHMTISHQPIPPSSNAEPDPDDPNWSPPSPKSGPVATLSASATQEASQNIGRAAVYKMMFEWEWKKPAMRGCFDIPDQI